jgi:hypothetical protein
MQECYAALQYLIDFEAARSLRKAQYVRYHHEDRTHLGLEKGTPEGRIRSEASGRVLSKERLGGLHHRYNRAAWFGSTFGRSFIYVRSTRTGLALLGSSSVPSRQSYSRLLHQNRLVSDLG